MHFPVRMGVVDIESRHIDVFQCVNVMDSQSGPHHGQRCFLDEISSTYHRLKNDEVRLTGQPLFVEFVVFSSIQPSFLVDVGQDSLRPKNAVKVILIILFVLRIETADMHPTQ